MRASRESHWLRRFPSRGATTRLFCLPYAGGSARIYSDWHDWLAPEVEVVAVELPGRGVHLRGGLVDGMDALVERLLGEIEPLLDRPFALFGHSLGAAVTYELARAVTARGGPQPSHLFASAMRAPHLPAREPSLHRLSDDELIAALRRAPGSPSALLEDDELLRLLLPVLRADFRLAETYTPGMSPRLGCPITVFGGLMDPTLERAELEAWREHTSAACVVRLLPGDHFFIHPFGHLVAVNVQNLLREQRCSASATDFAAAASCGQARSATT